MKSNHFTARALLPASGVQSNSDISSLVLDAQGELVVNVACSSDGDMVRGIRIVFQAPVAGFRFLDGLDLHRYVHTKGFPRGTHLIEVIDGGWLSEEKLLQDSELDAREWMVVTGNGCLSVFSSEEPQCSEITWAAEGA
ncbi:hypothetical protein [Herbaspirillum sp. CAH-3]|uniref:hypothetical protein n=1 Tax=Herbaspirillum sp. CAH-3 TaxID=2605746 RepID=UPI0012ACB691|nr:hypothetical protein [Herbaspirillum sp. CAH-3]MRT29776.1 hypothetical protein [Herbaspirillum sp. CAH-3]